MTPATPAAMPAPDTEEPLAEVEQRARRRLVLQSVTALPAPALIEAADEAQLFGNHPSRSHVSLFQR